MVDSSTNKKDVIDSGLKRSVTNAFVSNGDSDLGCSNVSNNYQEPDATYSLPTKHSSRLALPLSLGRVGAYNPYDFPILWQWLGRQLFSWLDAEASVVSIRVKMPAYYAR
jgi:hypothetical protein